MKKYLTLIFLLALILRTVKLAEIPEAIDEDEMAMGYYAYSLIKNGTDEYGNKFPIYFESIGDYKYGLYSYLATIPVFFLGLNAFSTRLTAAFFGSLTVVAIFFLVKIIFKNEKIALASSLILAVSPSHIHFSRVAYSNVTGLFFAIVFAIFLIDFFRNKNQKSLILAVAFYLLAIFTYQTYRVFLPVFAVGAFLVLFKSLKKKILQAFFLILFLVVIDILSLIPWESRARSQELSLLYDQKQIDEAIVEGAAVNVPYIINRAINNKLVSLSRNFSERYLSYFDPRFLFVNASSFTSRHTIPLTGFFYLVDILLLLIGLWFYRKLIRTDYGLIPILWIFSSPVAASFVAEERSTVRIIPITVGFVILFATGVVVLKKKILLLILLLYFANMFFVFEQYVVYKRYHQPWHSDVGLQEIVEATTQKYQKFYESIVVSGGHYMPFLFFGRVHPLEFQKNSEIIPKSQSKWMRVARFKNIYFNMPYECPLAGREKVLYVCFGYRLPIGARALEVFRFRDGQPAIILVEFVGENYKDFPLPERVERMKEIDERFKFGILPSDYKSFWPVS